MLFGLTEERLGATFTDVLHVLFVTGMFAALLSFHNVVARYAFAMGRKGCCPLLLRPHQQGERSPRDRIHAAVRGLGRRRARLRRHRRPPGR